jgi:hypothetical protein
MWQRSRGWPRVDLRSGVLQTSLPIQSRSPITMFLFFSNRLGCVGSLLLSAAITVVLILLLSR